MSNLCTAKLKHFFFHSQPPFLVLITWINKSLITWTMEAQGKQMETVMLWLYFVLLIKVVNDETQRNLEGQPAVDPQQQQKNEINYLWSREQKNCGWEERTWTTSTKNSLKTFLLQRRNCVISEYERKIVHKRNKTFSLQHQRHKSSN